MSTPILFALYQFDIIKCQQPKKEKDDIPFPETKDRKKITKKFKNFIELFENIFPTKSGSGIELNETLTKGRDKDKVTQVVPHHNKIEVHRDKLLIMSIQLNKQKKYKTEDWKDQSVGHFPPFRVIIDFRENNCIIAIEKSKAQDPEKAMKMLADSFNVQLFSSKLRFVYNRIEKKMNFWDAVQDIREKLEDKVNKVSFVFDNEGSIVNNDESQNLFVSQMLRWFKLMDARGTLGIDIRNDEKLQQVKDDLDHMSELCVKNKNYSLIVHFTKFGVFRFGQDIQAQLGMGERTIANFIKPKEEDIFEQENDEPLLSMLGWFDAVKKIYDKTEYGTKSSTIEPKRNTAGRI